MARLARLLSRFSLFRSIFGGKSKNPTRPKSGHVKPQEAPTAIIRSGPSLIGRDLLRSFGSGDTKTFAINDVSVDLKPNELNLLMGPSGSGKTTLLAVLSALLRPCGGQVTALGQNVWEMTENELEQFRLRHCSYVFQGYNLFPALTAREQLEIVLKWGEGVSTREAKKRSATVLGQLGLGSKMHLRPAQMSGGEKQRVAIGRALVKNPSFLFADEPTSALDWENGQQVIELLHGVARQRGATVLVVTHDPRLLPFADRIFEMADGQLQNNPKKGQHTAPRGQSHADDIVPLLQAGPALQPGFHTPVISAGFAGFQMTLPNRPAPQPRGPRLTLQEPAYHGS